MLGTYEAQKCVTKLKFGKNCILYLCINILALVESVLMVADSYKKLHCKWQLHRRAATNELSNANQNARVISHFRGESYCVVGQL